MSFKLDKSIDSMKKADLEKALRKAIQYIKTNPAVKAMSGTDSYNKVAATQYVSDGKHYTEIIEYTSDDKGNVFGKVKETKEHRSIFVRRLYFDDDVVAEKMIDQEVE